MYIVHTSIRFIFDSYALVWNFLYLRENIVSHNGVCTHSLTVLSKTNVQTSRTKDDTADDGDLIRVQSRCARNQPTPLHSSSNIGSPPPHTPPSSRYYEFKESCCFVVCTAMLLSYWVITNNFRINDNRKTNVWRCLFRPSFVGLEQT